MRSEVLLTFQTSTVHQPVLERSRLFVAWHRIQCSAEHCRMALGVGPEHRLYPSAIASASWQISHLIATPSSQPPWLLDLVVIEWLVSSPIHARLR